MGDAPRRDEEPSHVDAMSEESFTVEVPGRGEVVQDLPSFRGRARGREQARDEHGYGARRPQGPQRQVRDLRQHVGGSRQAGGDRDPPVVVSARRPDLHPGRVDGPQGPGDLVVRGGRIRRAAADSDRHPGRLPAHLDLFRRTPAGQVPAGEVLRLVPGGQGRQGDHEERGGCRWTCRSFP